MAKFKAGDWVTVSNSCLFKPEKKYQFNSDQGGVLYILNEYGDIMWYNFSSPFNYYIEKTTPPELETPPEEIEQNGYIYTRSRKIPHKWEWNTWAMYEGKKVFVIGPYKYDYIVISHPDFECNYEFVEKKKLTPITD